MTKTKLSPIPLDYNTLARWLANAPKVNLPRVKTLLLKAPAARYQKLAELVRVAIKQAWDEQPKVFFPLLSPWLKSNEVRLRRAAAGALPLSHQEYGDKSIRLLKKLILDKDRGVRLMVVDLLAEDVNRHLELVKRWAKDEDPGVRTLIARHIQSASQDNYKVILPLLGGLALDPDPGVHWAAASTLLELYGRESRPVLDIGRQMANSEDEGVRSAGAACFFEHILADHFDQLLPTLRSWLRSGDPWLRWTLVRSLGFIRITPRSLQLIRALYENKDPEIRRRVILVLLDLYDPLSEQRRSIVDILLRAQQDPSRRVRAAIDEGKARHGEDFLHIPDEEEEE